MSVLERATHALTSAYRVIVEDRDTHTVLAEKRWRLNVLMTLDCRDWRSNLYLPRLQDDLKVHKAGLETKPNHSEPES